MLYPQRGVLLIPEVSIHIVTHNSAHALERCFEGVRSQVGVEFSVSVFDNASSDNSVEIAKKNNFTVVESSVNLGYAAAHNRLIAQTQSTYVLTLNPDVFLLPGFLAAMVAALEQDPRLGSAAGNLLRIAQVGGEPDGIDGSGLFMRRSRRQLLRGHGAPLNEQLTNSTRIFGPDGAAAVYRRAMLEDIRLLDEYFDEDFFLHKEDIDLCWRAQLRGWESVYVPEAVAHHVRTFRPGTRNNVSAHLKFLGVRNRYLLMLKNEIGAHFLRDLLWIAAYDVGVLGYTILRERSSLRAYPSTLRLIKPMLKKRRLIQRQKRAAWRDLQAWFNG